MSSEPWAMLMTRMTPKISARPSATIAYRAPDSTPEMITCPIISGVSATLMETSPHARDHHCSSAGFAGAIGPLGLGEASEGAIEAPSELALVPGRRREARLGL